MNFDLTFYLIDQRLIALAMFGVLAAAGELGYRAGSRKLDSHESYRSLMSGIGAAMLGLLGLLLGFTLAMAIGRFDARHAVVVNESNAIGTLWLRAGFLEDADRDDLRQTLRDYTDVRISLGGSRDDLKTWRTARARSETLHSEIWSVVQRADSPGISPATLSSLITAANELIDLHELRLASIENFLPASLLLLLLGVATVSIYFLSWSFGAAGHGGRTAMVMLALLIIAVLWLIMDVNRPQRGRFAVGIATLERVANTIASPETP